MLCWNVFYGEFNTGLIKTLNIFDHWSFLLSCIYAREKFKDDKEGFAEEVKRSLAYHFWSKCEWEIVLSHWPDGELYELRRQMSIGKLVGAIRGAGMEYPYSESFRTNPERKVEVRVYPADNRFHDKKIDIYDQVMSNWDIFIDWLWEHRKELKEEKV